MASLVAYGAGDSSEDEEKSTESHQKEGEEKKEPSEDELLHLKSDSKSFKKLLNNTQLALAPTVVTKVSLGAPNHRTTHAPNHRRSYTLHL